MRKVIKLHLLVMILFIATFFTLGWIDKSRLDQASLAHKPKLLFAHQKLLVEDGGSVHWDSFIYRASETRRMVVTRLNNRHILDGFQGVSWKWKFHNLLWIALIVSVSFGYQFIKESKFSKG